MENLVQGKVKWFVITSYSIHYTKLYDARVVPGTGATNIFIYPPYQPKVVDMLLTNFHLPKSTLLMLVSAFAGRENVLKAYDLAVLV